MRRRQFLQLQNDLRAELKRSADPSIGVNDAPTLKQTINRVYESLHDSYDWPHLRTVFDRIPLQAGQRYYDLPNGLDYSRVEKIVVWWNDTPTPIERGIGFEEYATYISDNDERTDPVLKWDARYTDTHEQIEVWPIPASANQAIQFIGIQKFVPLVDDADLCRLDDKMIVLFSAVELLPAKAPDAQIKLAAAQSRLADVKGRSKGDSVARVRMGLGRQDNPTFSPTTVRVSG